MTNQEAHVEMDLRVPEKKEDAWMHEVFEHLHEFHIEDPIVTRLCRMFEARSNAGMLKYGMTMAANKGDLRYWLMHSIEEKMDDILYMLRALDEIPDDQQA